MVCSKSWKKKFDSDLTWLNYKKVPVKIMKSSWQVEVHSWQVDIHSWQVDVHSWQIHKNFLANLLKTSWQSLEGLVVYSQLYNDTILYWHSCMLTQLYTETVVYWHSCILTQLYTHTVVYWHSLYCVNWHISILT